MGLYDEMANQVNKLIPGSTYDITGDSGTATVNASTQITTDDDLLREAGFDPAEWSIKGAVRYRKSLTASGAITFGHSFGVERRKGAYTDVDVTDVIAQIVARQSGPQSTPGDGTDAFAFLAADWQIGKGEGGGSAATAARVSDAIDQAAQRVKNLRAIGYKIPHGAFLGLGDLVENVCGYYPAQGYLIDLNRRDQMRVARSLITYGIQTLAPLFDTFTIAAVGGNHGENRGTDGKKLTDDADNDDVALFETVREAFEFAGHTGYTWNIPQGEMSINVNLGGVDVGMTHGHFFRSSGQKSVQNWWMGQRFAGNNAVTDSQVLLSGHFHSLTVNTYGLRTHLQSPALDGGSAWFNNATGTESVPGAVTLRFDSSLPLGWDSLHVSEH